jgi:hypothetical protein
MHLVVKSVIAGLLATFLLIPSVGGAPLVNPLDTPRKPVVIPVQTIDTPGRTGQSGIISMKVGRSAPITVMVDTGSVGLRLWDEKPTGMQGSVANAYMTLGGVRTISRVSYQYIDTTSSYIQQWKDQGVDGTLGIGTGKGALTNPLMSLPNHLARSWSVHFSRDTDERAGQLVLGAIAPHKAILNFQLTRLTGSVGEASLWDDQAAQGCWTFSSPRTFCVPTHFDSRFTFVGIKGREFSRIPQNSEGELRSGTRVTLAARGNAYIGARFTAGKEGSRNLARVTPSGRSEINTGNSFYFSHVVTYNVTTGDIYLHEPTQKER